MSRFLKFGSLALTVAYLLSTPDTGVAQDFGKDSEPPKKKRKADDGAPDDESKPKKGMAKKDDADPKTDDDPGFGAARKKPAKGKVIGDDKEKEKLRKVIAGKLPKKEKAIFVIKTVEQLATPQVDGADRRPPRGKNKTATFSPTGEKIEYQCIAGREAAVDMLVEFLYQPKEPRSSTRKSRGKKGQDANVDLSPSEPRSHKSWQLMKQFDDSKEKDATSYCARLKEQQELLDKKLLERQRAQHGGGAGFGNG